MLFLLVRVWGWRTVWREWGLLHVRSLPWWTKIIYILSGHQLLDDTDLLLSCYLLPRGNVVHRGKKRLGCIYPQPLYKGLFLLPPHDLWDLFWLASHSRGEEKAWAELKEETEKYFQQLPLVLKVNEKSSMVVNKCPSPPKVSMSSFLQLVNMFPYLAKETLEIWVN